MSNWPLVSTRYFGSCLLSFSVINDYFQKIFSVGIAFFLMENQTLTRCFSVMVSCDFSYVRKFPNILDKLKAQSPRSHFSFFRSYAIFIDTGNHKANVTTKTTMKSFRTEISKNRFITLFFACANVWRDFKRILSQSKTEKRITRTLS